MLISCLPDSAGFSLFNRGLLCELKIRNGNQEVAARYEPFH
ncbi:Hok/Gef family protein [Atlantibacter hermannii]|nr:Hok/Gef family protein [Atlantibacter hermannii]